jgi:hypothetical protein
VTSWAVSISFGFVLEVSALKSTVAPLFVTRTHRHYLFSHFVPLLSTSYA